jgi:hypothetical protein
LPDARTFNTGVSTPVAAVLESALRLAPAERPASVTEFLQALRRVVPPALALSSIAPVPSPNYSGVAYDYNAPFGARDSDRPALFGARAGACGTAASSLQLKTSAVRSPSCPLASAAPASLARSAAFSCSSFC